MKTRAKFLQTLHLAGDAFLERTGGKKDLSTMVHDGDLLSVATIFGLQTTGTPSMCPIGQAIVSAAYYRSNPMRIIADAEDAWEWEQRRTGIGNLVA